MAEYFNMLETFLKSKEYFGNTLYNYSIAVLIFLGVVILITLIIKFAVNRLIHIENLLDNQFAVLIIKSFRRHLVYITYAIAVYSALFYLKTSDLINGIVNKAVLIYVAVIVIFALTDVLKSYNTVCIEKNRRPLPAGIVTILKTALWIGGLLFIFSNLGYNVNAFITGLGIGGIAVALAAQNILGDLFNYFVILFDKPFNKGDLIQFNTAFGRIERVGIKSTKIRNLTGELVSISNTDLIKAGVYNYEMARKRSHTAIINIEYETDKELVKKVPELLKQAVGEVANAEFVRVYLSSFESNGICFKLVFYVLTNDLTEYTTGIQSVNFAILDKFKENNIKFAYPLMRVLNYGEK